MSKVLIADMLEKDNVDKQKIYGTYCIMDYTSSKTRKDESGL